MRCVREQENEKHILYNRQRDGSWVSVPVFGLKLNLQYRANRAIENSLFRLSNITKGLILHGNTNSVHTFTYCYHMVWV